MTVDDTDVLVVGHWLCIPEDDVLKMPKCDRISKTICQFYLNLYLKCTCTVQTLWADESNLS